MTPAEIEAAVQAILAANGDQHALNAIVADIANKAHASGVKQGADQATPRPVMDVSAAGGRRNG